MTPEANGRDTMTKLPPPAPTTSATEFRRVMSGHAAGVAVVTAGRSGTPAGLTVTSLTSYSDLPPSVCFNVRVTARSHPAVVEADAIGVHLLGTDQRHIAEVFSGSAGDKFSGLDWSWDRSVPRLPGALAYLHCQPVAVFRHGDHSLVVAEVERVHSGSGAPLVYLHRTLGWRLARVER